MTGLQREACIKTKAPSSLTTRTAAPSINPAWSAVRALARITRQELLRERVLYNGLFVSTAWISLSIVASKLSLFWQDRVILNFGIFATTVSSVGLAVFLGARLIPRELERRTAHLVLTRPISWVVFVAGKYCGLLQILLLNLLILSFVLTMVLFLSGGSLSFAYGAALLLIGAQSALVAAITVFFTSFMATSLAIFSSVGVFLIGSNLDQLRWLAEKTPESFLRLLLQSVTVTWPPFERFQLGYAVTYGLPVSVPSLLTAGLVALSGVFLGIGLAGVIFKRKGV